MAKSKKSMLKKAIKSSMKDSEAGDTLKHEKTENISEKKSEGDSKINFLSSKYKNLKK